MQLGDAASWATIIGVPIALIGLWLTIRSAVSKRQRELRGQLREVLRKVSDACYWYPIEQERRTACRVLREASEALKVIEDEGIRSPNRHQIKELHQNLYDLATREEAFTRAEPMFAMAMSPEERANLRPNFNRGTENLLRYVSRLAAHYRKVTSKMDNGNIFTYWHYRLLPPYIIKGREPRRRRPHNYASEE